VEVNEAICEARPAAPAARRAPPAGTGRKSGLCAQLQAQAAAVEHLAGVAARSLAGGGAGLEAAELAIRTAMTGLGAALLEDLLALDTGHRGQWIDCGPGH
jgi:hypothetical protein